MAKKVEILKIMILFLFLLFGCSHKYVDVEGESLDEKVVASWEELDCRVVEKDEEAFSLCLQVRDISVVGGSKKLAELYRRGSQEKEDGRIPFGVLAGVGGCIGGCYYGLHDNNIFSWDGYDEEDGERFNRGCFISFISCATGLSIVFWGIDERRKAAEAISGFIKRDTVCTDSTVLSKQKIKISVEKTDLEKTYYTDEDGNLELGFKEIIPEYSGIDSVFNLIIRYYELVDTVEVWRL